ncbi:MAG: hypothetical protein DSY33_01155 [Archaeoglobus sp.]|nr:MAG: hypothetical protein DSY33_01155 [Archaeoglobus sp.]
MTTMSVEIIPAQIKMLDLPQGRKNTLVFSINDIFENTSIVQSKNEIILEFENLIKEIQPLLYDKPSSTPKKTLWEIGRKIVKFRKNIIKKYRIYITNLNEAISNTLGVSESFIGYVVKFSNFSLKRQIDEKIPWSTYMEALNLPNKREFYYCLKLIKEGKLNSSKEVRGYVKSRNALLKNKNKK